MKYDPALIRGAAKVNEEQLRDILLESSRYEAYLINNHSTFSMAFKVGGRTYALYRTRNRGLRTFKTYDTAYKLFAELTPFDMDRVLTVIHLTENDNE